MIRCGATVSLLPEAKGGPFLFWDGLEHGLKTSAELGFDGVEIFPPSPDALDPATVRSLLQQYNLGLDAVGSGGGWVRHKLSLTHADAAHREQAIHFIKGMIDFAGQLGAPTILGSMQGRWGDGVSREVALAYLAEACNVLGEHAKQYGVPFLYEPLNRYETNLLNTVGDGVAFLKTLRTTNVKLLADLFHMNIEEANVAGAIRAAEGYIGHIHFADSNRKPAGLGHTDFAPIAAAIKATYSGYLTAEAFPYPDPVAAGRQTMESFRRWFR
jgi:sugar phosphate isomerase/epimerase